MNHWYKYNIDESQNNYAGCKKPGKKLFVVCSCIYKICKLIYSAGRQITGCMEMGRVGEELGGLKTGKKTPGDD